MVSGFRWTLIPIATSLPAYTAIRKAGNGHGLARTNPALRRRVKRLSNIGGRDWHGPETPLRPFHFLSLWSGPITLSAVPYTKSGSCLWRLP